MAAPQITPLPDPPSRQDPANFAARGDAFLGAFPTLQTEINTATNYTEGRLNEAFNAGLEDVPANALRAETAASNALVSEQNAADFANAAQQTTLGFETNRPNLRPALNLDFVNQALVDPRIEVTRASNKTIQSNVKALSEENLFRYSEDFTTRAVGAGWIVQNGTATIDTELAPNGELTADIYTGAAGTSVKRVAQATSPVSGSDFYFSAYVKAGTNNFVQLVNDLSSAYANFDVLNGVAGDSGGASLVASGIEPANNGFYRVWIRQTSTTEIRARILLVTSNTAVANEPNALTTNFIVWGGQYEQAKLGQTEPSAYIKTLAYPERNYLNKLVTLPPNTINVEYDPITEEVLGVVSENTGTNLVLQSQAYENAEWVKLNGTVSDNRAIAPDGTLTAGLFIPDGNTATTSLMRTVTTTSFTAGTRYVLSGYYKAFGASTNILMLIAGGAGTVPGGTQNVAVAFDTATGQITSVQGNSNGIAPIAGSYPVGDGWYRVHISFIAENTGETTIQYVREGLQTDNNGFNGVLTWGFQAEANTTGLPSSYIPTTTAQATRAAQSLRFGLDQFNYNHNEGSIFVELETAYGDTENNKFILRLSDDTNFNYIELTTRNTGTGERGVIFDSRENNVLTVFAATQNGVLTENTPHRIVITFKENLFSFYFDGVLISTDTDAPVPTNLTSLYIGSRELGADAVDAPIRSVKYYPKALTVLEAQALSQL